MTNLHDSTSNSKEFLPLSYYILIDKQQRILFVILIEMNLVIHEFFSIFLFSFVTIKYGEDFQIKNKQKADHKYRMDYFL